MNNELRKEIQRISNLKQNKGKDIPQSVLEEQARLSLLIKNFNENPLFEDSPSQTLAKNKFKYYVSNYDLSGEAELDVLRSLVYNEVIESKIQKSINTDLDNGKSPDRLMKQLTDIQNQKISLRKKLNIEKEEEKEDSAYKYLETLKKRFIKHVQNNPHEFTTYCKHCAKPLLIAKRVKDFESMKHPWIVGRWFFNYEILKDVKEGIITKEQAWRYMCCSSEGGNYKSIQSKEYCTDYIDYCFKHWDEIVSHIE